jgi:methionine-rich copper-binding protein CopC
MRYFFFSYELMQDCWKLDAKVRPNFYVIVQRLHVLLADEAVGAHKYLRMQSLESRSNISFTPSPIYLNIDQTNNEYFQYHANMPSSQKGLSSNSTEPVLRSISSVSKSTLNYIVIDFDEKTVKSEC